MRARREASLSCRAYAICLIDFNDIDSSEDSHGGCDRWLVMAERRFGCVEDSRHRFSCVSGVGDLQQRSCQEGATTQVDSILLVLSTEPSCSG